jgi:hypothetical protein
MVWLICLVLRFRRGVIKIEIADKYFVNRLGYKECKEIEYSKNIYDLLGYIEINITKKNEKSFRCDYDDNLYKEVPSGWYEYDEKLLHRLSLNKIANIFTNDRYYIDRGRKAFNLLSQDDKKKVCALIKDTLKKEAERLYLNSIYTVNSRIVDTRYKLTDKDRIIEKYTEESEV